MDVLLDEIESLEAILMDDVKIIRNQNTNFPELIETTVLPTVGEDVDRQYVCVTLQVMPVEGYPDVSPKFNLKNPRGLDDCSLNIIEKSIVSKLEESIGVPVVFDLIEVIREHLTSSNLPSGQCVVCLYGFQEGDTFTKTECYHFLHSYCLARHLIALKKNYQEEYDKLPGWQKKLSKPYQPVCPVCREVINDNNVDELLTADPPAELENAPKFQLTNELKSLQSKMTNLYLRQKARGGIIDLDACESSILMLGGDEELNETKYRSGNTVTDNMESGGGVSNSEVCEVTTTTTTSQPNNVPSPSHRNNYQKYSNNRGPNNYNNKSSAGNNSRQMTVPNQAQTNTSDADTQMNQGRSGDDDGNSSNYNHRHHNRHRRGPHRHHNHHNRHHHHHNTSNHANSNGSAQQQNSAQQSCSSNPR